MNVAIVDSCRFIVIHSVGLQSLVITMVYRSALPFTARRGIK